MRQEIREQRRRLIVAAALATFAARGYDKTTMDDIRAASDVSKGTLYLYFDSKEALFAAVVEAAFADIQAALDESLAADRSAPPDERLADYLRVLTQYLGEGDQRTGLYTDFFVQAWQHDSVRHVLAQAYTDYARSLVALIQQAMDAGAIRASDASVTARVIIGALDGIVLQKLLDPQADLGPALDRLVDVILCGLQIAPDA